MNRLISTNLDQFTPEKLPPVVSRGNVARVLFLNTTALGFRTQLAQLQRYTSLRDDIDAVHIDLQRPLWMKVLTKTVPLQHCGWDLHSWRFAQLSNLQQRRWFSRVLDPTRFDVIFWTTQVQSLSSLWLRKRCAARFGVLIDCTGELEIRCFGESPTATRPFIRCERRSLGGMDIVVAMNRWAADSVRDDYGVSERRILVAPGCVPAPPRASCGGTPPRILFVGNPWRAKGGEVLFAIHQEKFADRAELHIVCDTVNPRPEARNVVWHGRMPHDRLLGELLPTMDLLVLPTYRDVSPWVVVEAIAAGLPVVATRVGAIPELVVHGQTGFLCAKGHSGEYAEAIGRLIDDGTLRREMGAAAHAHARQEYHPDTVYNRMLDRIVELAKAPRLAGEGMGR